VQPLDASLAPREPQPVLPSAPAEIVHRPDPGTLGRGAWEAPAWSFYVSAAVVVVAAALYAVVRLGWARRRRGARKR
jgi:hypothetical protein